MYEIVATVTTSAPNGFKLMGHWPHRWWQARFTRFTMIQRRLLPNETLPAPQEPVIEEEISVDKDRCQDLEIGDRVIVRAFWPGEFGSWPPDTTRGAIASQIGPPEPG